MIQQNRNILFSIISPQKIISTLIIVYVTISCSTQSSYIQPWHTRNIKTIYVKPFTTELSGETMILSMLTEEAKNSIQGIGRIQVIDSERDADAVFTGELIDKYGSDFPIIIFNYWLVGKNGEMIGENSGYIQSSMSIQTNSRGNNLELLIRNHFKNMTKLFK